MTELLPALYPTSEPPQSWAQAWAEPIAGSHGARISALWRLLGSDSGALNAVLESQRDDGLEVCCFACAQWLHQKCRCYL